MVGSVEGANETSIRTSAACWYILFRNVSATECSPRHISTAIGTLEPLKLNLTHLIKDFCPELLKYVPSATPSRGPFIGGRILLTERGPPERSKKPTSRRVLRFFPEDLVNPAQPWASEDLLERAEQEMAT